MKTLDEIVLMLENDIIKYEKTLKKLNINNPSHKQQKELLERKIFFAKKDLLDWKEIINENSNS